MAHEWTKQLQDIQASLDQDLLDSQRILGDIGHVLSTMQMLALNTGIEAAKAGSQGKGFSVIAVHMTKSVESVRHLTTEMLALNDRIKKASTLLEQVHTGGD